MTRRNAKLKILFASAEVSPLVSSGGLGEVAQALPRALRETGHDVRMAMPCYGVLPPEARGESCGMVVAQLNGRELHGALRRAVAPGSDAPLYLVEHNGFYDRPFLYGPPGREYEDALERFAFFCAALLDGIAQTGWKPDVVHCNDWHTALTVAHIVKGSRHRDFWQGTPTVYTIHNLNYQGVFPPSRLGGTGLGREAFTSDGLEHFGDINLMKAGLALSTKVSVVSPEYAKEVRTPGGGAGLDGVLRARGEDVVGILNGVDYGTWNPATDPLIPRCYSPEDLSGKGECRAWLQDLFHLPRRNVPVVGMVTRLNAQKGVDLVVSALDALLGEDLQLVVLGAGDPYLEHRFREEAGRFPAKMGLCLAFDPAMAHKVFAGSDFFLMPSRFEPCGLGQMYALAYGAVPIVRNTGGLADTVVNATPTTLGNGKATGLVFEDASETSVFKAVLRALKLYSEPEDFEKVRLAGMRADFSWRRSAEAYTALYRDAISHAGS